MSSYRRIKSITLNRAVNQQDNMVTFMKPIAFGRYPSYFSVPDASNNHLLVSNGSPYGATAAPKLTFDGTKLDISANLLVNGTILAKQFLPGQVVNMVMLGYTQTDLSQNPLTIGPGDDTDNLFTITYTPKIANSYIICEYQTIYDVDGNGSDFAEAYLYVNDPTESRISQTFQQWTGTDTNTTGTGTRSGTIFPIVGRYTNTNTTVKTIRVDVHTSTDTINFNGDNSTWLKITEIAR